VRDTHVASSVVDVLRVATDGGARELLRVVLDEAPGAAGGCAIVGAVDGARAADLFGEVVDDSLRGGANAALLSHGTASNARGQNDDRGSPGLVPLLLYLIAGIANGWSDGLLVYDESGAHGSLSDPEIAQ